jgi:electron-transferring-flavoprotein dehydrogenase
MSTEDAVAGVQATWMDAPELEVAPATAAAAPAAQHERLEVDIACAGFGPAMGGFLTTLTQAWKENPGDPAFASKVMAGIPLQVLCYERADDLAAGVSGVVTRAEGIRASFPGLKADEIPMAVEVRRERVLYLMDPIGASRRSALLRAADLVLSKLGPIAGVRDSAFELPWTPGFLHKRGGLVMSIGQFNQWVATQLMSAGLAQIWPGMPVSAPMLAEPPAMSSNGAQRRRAVCGLRLVDQGVDKEGAAAGDFVPGTDVYARLTVVGDGPVGAVGRALDEKFCMPDGHAKREWALGMKMVIELPEDATHLAALRPDAPAADAEDKSADDEAQLQPGTVWHTFGYPEPEIFGFLYVHPGRLVSVGIFVPSWMGDPARTAYRYLQHYIQHPAIWKYLNGGRLRSWGAKSLDESGRRGEPVLAGDGFVRIGEGSGSTNVLTGSGVDEAWMTGVQLGHAVLELLRADKPFTKENLEATYEIRRRRSLVDLGALEAEHARDGFHRGFVRGLVGMALAGLTGGRLALEEQIPLPVKQIQPLEAHLRADPKQRKAVQAAREEGRPLHDALMSARGWPEIAYDGRLLVSHQDALLMGGKVQAAPGFADHVAFRNKNLCAACKEKTCVSMCSGQAITAGSDGIPVFEREKCVHCGACLWNCAHAPVGESGNVEFRAGAGGLHSAEN